MELQRLFARLILIIFLIVLGLGYLAWTPGDLEEYDGYQADAMEVSEANNFLLSVRNSIQNGKSVQITERDLNRLIKAKFQQEHSLAIKPWITPKGIYANLTDNHIELAIERDLNGFRLHQSEIAIEFTTDLRTTQSKQFRNLKLSPSHGKVGKLKLPKIFAGGLNTWFTVFAEKTRDQLVALDLQYCNYKVSDGVLVISPNKHKDIVIR